MKVIQFYTIFFWGARFELVPIYIGFREFAYVQAINPYYVWGSLNCCNLSWYRLSISQFFQWSNSVLYFHISTRRGGRVCGEGMRSQIVYPKTKHSWMILWMGLGGSVFFYKNWHSIFTLVMEYMFYNQRSRKKPMLSWEFHYLSYRRWEQ